MAANVQYTGNLSALLFSPEWHKLCSGLRRKNTRLTRTGNIYIVGVLCGPAPRYLWSHSRATLPMRYSLGKYVLLSSGAETTAVLSEDKLGSSRWDRNMGGGDWLECGKSIETCASIRRVAYRSAQSCQFPREFSMQWYTIKSNDRRTNRSVNHGETERSIPWVVYIH